ncbi:MAG: hypothetical protein JO115_03430 [Pseudonocardiales bacterium]|nr:hypothetical protein [Pseudonocardiales bacterium]
MRARAVRAWGIGIAALLLIAINALIHELDRGWPWLVALAVVASVSTALSIWLAWSPVDGPLASGNVDQLGPGAVKAGRDIRGNVTTISQGQDAGQSPAAALGTAKPWSLGPGAIQAKRDINGPVHVTIINGAFDQLSNAIFDAQPLETVLDLAHFTGREWLIDSIDAYIAREPCGYVVVQAEAGVGKSALAAHLVWTRPCAYHFTRLDGGRSPEQARRSLAAQLIGAWRLHDDLTPGDSFPTGAGRPDWLLRVLKAAAARRDENCPGQPLVLIVDGLDEADSPGHGHDTDTGIPLGLPRPEHLPRGVFIVVTSRFGLPLPALHSPAVSWHTITVEGSDNLTDMRRFVTDAVTGASPQRKLVDILAASHVTPQEFIESLLERCGGVWMYLRYVLDEILAERRDPADIHTLPDRLVGYYLEQIHRWRRDLEGWQRLGLPVVATLVALRRPATGAEIARLADVPDGEPLRYWLDEQVLRPFLDVTHDPHGRRLYAIRHHSLRELFAPLDKFGERDAGTRDALHNALLAAHQRITAALIPSGLPGERDWGAADGYTRGSLAEHAAYSGRLDELACDPGFLLVCDAASLLRYRASVITDDARAAIAAYELALDQWARCDGDKLRAWWLYVWACKTRSRSLTARTVTHVRSEWRVITAMWTGSSHRTLTGHTGTATAA